MADWSLPALTTPKVNVLSMLNEKLAAAARMEYGSDTNLPSGTVRWSVANNRFEQWSAAGGSWGALTNTYSINVSTFDGQAAAFYRNASNLNAGTVATARLPSASTSARGAVQLTTSTSSTSTTLAPTASALKAVGDALAGKASSSHGHGASDLPSASTGAPGVAQLNSAVNSTSNSQAATPSAVKAAYDLAASKASGSHTHGASDLPSASISTPGVVQLSSAINSTSNSQAATPSAVKVAYDLAYTKATINQMMAYEGNISGYRLHSNYIRMNDGVSVRLGSGDDFRMWDNGTAAYFRSYRHGGVVNFQGENVAGTNRTCISYDPDGAVGLYYGGNLKLGTSSGGVAVSGRVYTDYITIYNSDERLKKNVRDIDGQACAKILDAVRWVLFDWIKAGEETGVPGVIAQQVKKIYPEAVYKKEDGFYGVAYDKLFSLQMRASQWERKRLSALEKRIEFMEAA